MNLAESAYTMTMEEAMTEAHKQFAMAEIDPENAWLWERGGWHMLLWWTALNHDQPYCAKLAGPCPNSCEPMKVQCTDRLAGDCWRVKQPPT